MIARTARATDPRPKWEGGAQAVVSDSLPADPASVFYLLDACTALNNCTLGCRRVPMRNRIRRVSTENVETLHKFTR